MRGVRGWRRGRQENEKHTLREEKSDDGWVVVVTTQPRLIYKHVYTTTRQYVPEIRPISAQILPAPVSFLPPPASRTCGYPLVTHLIPNP